MLQEFRDVDDFREPARDQPHHVRPGVLLAEQIGLDVGGRIVAAVVRVRVLPLGGDRLDVGRKVGRVVHVVELLFDTKSFKAEFQTFDDPTKFNGNLRRFEDYFEACNYALGKAESWTAVERTRVVPALE